jgi:hypothetical protein
VEGVFSEDRIQHSGYNKSQDPIWLSEAGLRREGDRNIWWSRIEIHDTGCKIRGRYKEILVTLAK